MNQNEIVGFRIRQIRDDLGLTMKEFANVIDDKAGSGTVNNWESGLNLPNRKRTKRIAELGNISVDELLGRSRNKSVGRKIFFIRKSLGLTMEEFGKHIGSPVASKGNISNWESGVSMPNNKRLKKIAELGNTTVEELLSIDSGKTVDEITCEIKESFSEDEIKQIIRNLI